MARSARADEETYIKCNISFQIPPQPFQAISLYSITLREIYTFMKIGFLLLQALSYFIYNFKNASELAKLVTLTFS